MAGAGVEIKPVGTVEWLLSAIKLLLEEDRKMQRELYPQPGDEDNYIADTQACPASAVTTITWTFKKDYEIYFKKLYIDLVANVTYVYTFSNLIGFYAGRRSFNGNLLEFTMPLKVKGGSTLALAITNSGASAVTLDILIDSWARRTR